MPTISSKPTLYNGHRVPFDELEPEPFASFVCGALQIVGQRFGWKDFSQPEVGADGGFDVEARTNASQVVCIQCKRYKDPISVPELANELAKVAINSCLDQADVGSYLLITSGTLRQKLRKALRASSRQDIRKESIERAFLCDKFKDFQNKLHGRGLKVSDVVGSFVDNIELRVWSGTNFDDYLGVNWFALQSLIERTFSVHTFVKEHPRPEFNKQS